MIVKNQYISSLVYFSLSFAVCAQDTVTQYQYDSRGRLRQVVDSAGGEINYTYDEAGNRLSVANQAAGAPIITSFTGPSSVSTVGASVTLSWTSTGTSYCDMVSNSDNYSNLPVNGSQSIRIYDDTGVTLTCYNGIQFDSAGKLIRLTSGGSKN